MSKISDLLDYGRAEVGKPYVYGAEGPNSFDCSGLMQYTFAKIGITLPRTAAQQQRSTTRVTSPQTGDLVFWGEPAHHVALYVGNNKVLSAPHAGATVRVQDLWGSPTYGRVKGITGGTPTASSFLGLAADGALNGAFGGNTLTSAAGDLANTARSAVGSIASVGVVADQLVKLAMPTNLLRFGALCAGSALIFAGILILGRQVKNG